MWNFCGFGLKRRYIFSCRRKKFACVAGSDKWVVNQSNTPTRDVVNYRKIIREISKLWIYISLTFKPTKIQSTCFLININSSNDKVEMYVSTFQCMRMLTHDYEISTPRDMHTYRWFRNLYWPQIITEITGYTVFTGENKKTSVLKVL